MNVQVVAPLAMLFRCGQHSWAMCECVCVDGTATASNNTSIISSISIDKSREVFDHWRCHQNRKNFIRFQSDQFATNNLLHLVSDFRTIFLFYRWLFESDAFVFIVGNYVRWSSSIECNVESGGIGAAGGGEVEEVKLQLRWMNNENNRDAVMNASMGWEDVNMVKIAPHSPLPLSSSNDWLCFSVQFTAGCGGMSTLPDNSTLISLKCRLKEPKRKSFHVHFSRLKRAEHLVK